MTLPHLTRRAALLTGTAAAATFAIGGRSTETWAGAAPKLDPLRPTAYRFALGDFQVTTVLDGATAMDGPFPIFGENQTAEAVSSFAASRLLPPDKLVGSFTPVVVNTGADLVLFDAGNPPGARPGTGLLAERLKASGIDPAQVTVVVVTHFHPDHIGGLMTDGKPTFPNARYVWNAAEYDFWSKPERLSGPAERVAKLVQSNIVPLKEKATAVAPGADVVTGIRAVDASGHTPGHTAFQLDSGGKRLLIGADFCNHFVLSLEQPDWHVRFDMDKEKAAATRKTILSMLAAERIPFTSYHMPFPAVGFVEANGASFRYVPVTYQFDI
jgi:glyoxylase-like metal-dependent hydrolase (beta-lactamase superfamily II)